MLSPLAMAGTAAIAGATALLSMSWVVLASLSADGTRGRAWALLAATAALAVAPLGLRMMRSGGGGPDAGPVFLGATLLVVAAAVCLWRLRGVAGAGWAARVGIGACLIVWATLWVLWSDRL